LVLINQFQTEGVTMKYTDYELTFPKPDLLVNRKDLDFFLFDWLKIDAEDKTSPPRSLMDRSEVSALLDKASTIAREKMLPFAATIDENQPKLEDGKVFITPEVKEILQTLIKEGFWSLFARTGKYKNRYSETVESALLTIFSSSEVSSTSYLGLALGAARLVDSFCSPELKEKYLQPMYEGRFFGTMVLSETEHGSTLSHIQTTADPQNDGTYHIKGEKTWISAGDHDLSENNIHMVLARTPDAPEGIRGISLFLVPKYPVNDDHSLGERNGYDIVRINPKMGARSYVNNLMRFGDTKPCLGYLVGQENMGLAYMFQMMNESRIAVGQGAAVMGYAGYQYAVAYAKWRVQGKAMTAKKGDPPTPIINHPDIRRMLLMQKCYAEGSLALCMYASNIHDKLMNAGTDEERNDLYNYYEFLTPIVKSYPSEWGLEANKLAIQVLGGAGYVRLHPTECFYRNNRINAIHEGTHGVQAVDLLGRKIARSDGIELRILSAQIDKTCLQAEKISELRGLGAELMRRLHQVLDVTEQLLEINRNGDRVKFLADSTAYLDMMGHLLVGWLWLDMSVAASQKLNGDSKDADPDFLNGKIHACQFYFEREIPKIDGWISSLLSEKSVLLDIKENGF